MKLSPFEKLKLAIQGDEMYAWTWHCQIACAAQDEGIEHALANKIANRAMQMIFGVDTKEPTPTNAREGTTEEQL